VSRFRLFLLMALVGAARLNFAGTNDFFAQGIGEYRAGHFPAAAKAFAAANARQPAVGALLNQGITEWQRGHVGSAILAWEQARWIDPFCTAANQNLAFARRVAQVGAPELKWFETASTWLPPNLWVWLAGTSLWLAVGAVTLPGLFRRRKSGRLQTLAALGLGAFLFCFAANLGVVSRTHIGFVVSKETPLLLTPTRTGEVITTLSDGEPVRCLRRHGNYWLAQTPDGMGWIAREQMGLVNPE
jgi:hypothetical protein